MICRMLCTSSGIWCMFSLEVSPLRPFPDVSIFSLFLPLPHSTNSKASSSDPLPHIIISHFFFTSIFTSYCLPLSTLIFILYIHINRTSLSPLFFTSSSSSSSFPFPSTIGLLPGSWLIKGYVTALTVFLITFQVLNFERSLNLLSLFWHTLTAHFKPSKLTPRARIDWHNTPLFKEKHYSYLKIVFTFIVRLNVSISWWPFHMNVLVRKCW